MAGLVLLAPFAGPRINQSLSDASDSAPDDEQTASLAGEAGTETDAAGQNINDGSGGVTEATKQCSADLAQIEEAVHAAGRGIDRWSVHVQARTDMLAGRISEGQMEAIYDRTRAHGHHDVQRFSGALSNIERQVPCEELKASPGEATTTSTGDCLARSEAAETALAAAKSTMDEWATHLHHMDQYADGGMRTGKALELWIEAWRKAPAGISDYRDHAARLAAAPSCSGG